MEIKCIVCEWEWYTIEEEEVHHWETCPNCDFPFKFTEWVGRMQNEIKDLKEENNRISKKLNGMIR